MILNKKLYICTSTIIKGNKIMSTLTKVKSSEAYYDYTVNTSTYYVKGFAVATLNHDTETFEDLEEMTEADKDFYYEQMLINYNEYKNQ